MDVEKERTEQYQLRLRVVIYLRNLYRWNLLRLINFDFSTTTLSHVTAKTKTVKSSVQP